MNQLPGRPHVQRPVSSFYDFLEASNRRTLAIERLLSASVISLEEAQQRLGILSPERGFTSPPDPIVPPDPPGYTLLYGDFSHPRPSDLSFGPGYYPEPLPWWIYWTALWVGVSAILAVGMIFHVLP